MLMVVLVIASAIAGLAAISSGRVVHETKAQQVLGWAVARFSDSSPHSSIERNSTARADAAQGAEELRGFLAVSGRARQPPAI